VPAAQEVPEESAWAEEAVPAEANQYLALPSELSVEPLYSLQPHWSGPRLPTPER
jgi:hypothetical protein